jgi:hypothetical protein
MNKQFIVKNQFFSLPKIESAGKKYGGLENSVFRMYAFTLMVQMAVRPTSESKIAAFPLTGDLYRRLN